MSFPVRRLRPLALFACLLVALAIAPESSAVEVGIASPHSWSLDEYAAANLVGYLHEQLEATSAEGGNGDNGDLAAVVGLPSAENE
jgi:hypothetical protein